MSIPAIKQLPVYNCFNDMKKFFRVTKVRSYVCDSELFKQYIDNTYSPGVKRIAIGMIKSQYDLAYQ